MSHPPPLSPRLLLPSLPLPLLLLLTIALLVPPTPALAQTCNYTLDSCTKATDCCTPLTCAATVRTGDVACTPKLKNCFCRPFSPVVCKPAKNSAECSFGEGCGFRKDNGNLFCISCSVLKRKISAYRFASDGTRRKCESDIEKGPPPSPSPTPTPTIIVPPRGAFDFCGGEENISCAEGLVCRTLPYAFECASFDTMCVCLPEKKAPRVCNPADCNDGETCATNVYTNVTQCTACHVIYNNIGYVFAKSSKRKERCSERKPREFDIPTYPGGANGLSYELCFSDVECNDKLFCAENAKKRCLDGDTVCRCLDIGEGKIATCDRNGDCLKGESCAFIKSERVKRCVANRVLDRFSADTFSVFAIREPVRGKMRVGDECKADWDCKKQLACTHGDDALGGCATREGCVCKPYRFQRCSGKKSECSFKEKCVNVPGSRQTSFCYSDVALSDSRKLGGILHEVKRANRTNVNFKNATMTPTPKHYGGETGAPCSPEEGVTCKNRDASRKRVCRHVTEDYGACNGRNYCVCKATYRNRCFGKDGECDVDEVCGRLQGSINRRGECISRKVSETKLWLLTHEVIDRKTPSR